MGNLLYDYGRPPGGGGHGGMITRWGWLILDTSLLEMAQVVVSPTRRVRRYSDDPDSRSMVERNPGRRGVPSGPGVSVSVAFECWLPVDTQKIGSGVVRRSGEQNVAAGARIDRGMS